jgi:hypothetical protein
MVEVLHSVKQAHIYLEEYAGSIKSYLASRGKEGMFGIYGIVFR